MEMGLSWLGRARGPMRIHDSLTSCGLPRLLYIAEDATPFGPTQFIDGGKYGRRRHVCVIQGRRITAGKLWETCGKPVTMEDVFPDTRLFDELEFLRFSDDQFAMDANTAGAEEEKVPLFAAVTHDCNQLRSPSPALHTLTELKEAVASCTVGIYRSPEPEKNWFETATLQEKTLNALITGANDIGVLEACSSKPVCCQEEASVTSPVSVSAACKMSPVQANPMMLQSTEVSQTPSALTAELEVEKKEMKRKLKVMCTPSGPGIKPLSLRQSRGNSAGRSVRRKRTVTEVSNGSDSSFFKGSKKVKRYQEAPFDNPELERSRLNAINAKMNRDKKKKELKDLHQKCDSLASENKTLSSTNRDLEGRLRAAEEEITFLRNIVMGRLGLTQPGLDGAALKSVFGGNSAPAGG